VEHDLQTVATYADDYRRPVFDLHCSPSAATVMAKRRFVMDLSSQEELDVCDVYSADLARGNDEERSVTVLKNRGYEVRRDDRTPLFLKPSNPMTSPSQMERHRRKRRCHGRSLPATPHPRNARRAADAPDYVYVGRPTKWGNKCDRQRYDARGSRDHLS